MRNLKIFCGALAFFLLAYSQPLSAQSYQITENELQQIEQDQQTILQESQELKQQLQKFNAESEKKLNELATQSIELNKRLKEQAEQLQKYEKRKKAFINYGVPAICATVTAAFIGGVYIGATNF